MFSRYFLQIMQECYIFSKLAIIIILFCASKSFYSEQEAQKKTKIRCHQIFQHFGTFIVKLNFVTRKNGTSFTSATEHR